MIDRILYNGNIITQDEKKRRVTAIAITGGRIVAVGDDDDILDLQTANTIRENLGGQTVIPGLTDAHIHWQWTSRSLYEVDVYEVPNKQVAIERVAERVAMSSPNDWITGHGWSQEFWADKQFPCANDLDAVSPNNPVYLRAKSGHAVWVNHAALRATNITATTPDPEGGHIGRDEHGNPDGMLFENAIQLVFQHMPHPTVEQIAEQMKSAQKLALSAGLTGMHDFDGPRCFAALQLLHEAGDLAVRVVKNINDPQIHHAHELGIRWGFGDDWLRIGGLKIFADGALGQRTALMIDPYNDDPTNFGIRVTEKAHMLELVRTASLNGLPSTIHAIGDLAVRDVLDVYEAVREEERKHGISPDSRRHRIEHVQIIHPDDKHRMAQLKIIASMQPIHATSDYMMADRYWGNRCEWAYNPRLQLDQGVVVAFGSDSPIEPFDPIPNIYAAVTRRRIDGSPSEEGWYPQNKVTVEEALHGFTIAPAYAAGMENRLGKIATNYLADLVVLDRDLIKVPAEEILETQVLATMVGGDWKFGGV